MEKQSLKWHDFSLERIIQTLRTIANSFGSEIRQTWVQSMPPASSSLGSNSTHRPSRYARHTAGSE